MFEEFFYLHLPVRISPLPFESFFSYIVRFSHSNCMNLLELWDICRAKPNRFATRNEIAVLNYAPQNTINLEKLSEFSDMTVNDLLGLSFHNLLRKFGGDDETPRSRVMMGMLHNEYHYCRECLRETPYHLFLWSLKDIKICYKHYTRLETACIHCGKIIHLKELENFISCPYCNGSLTDKVNSFHYNNCSLKKQQWLIDNFIFLNSNQGSSISYRDLVLKILYILNQYESILNKDNVCQALYNNSEKLHDLLKRARNTCKQNVNLSFLMDILYQNECSFKQLFRLKVPNEFKESVLMRRTPLISTLTCLASWCSKKKGSLIKTGTHCKRNRKGKFKYYVICPECGCRYGVNSNNKLVEVTKYISMYCYLSSITNKEISLQKASRESGFSCSMLKKGIAYFDSREVLAFENYQIEYHDVCLRSVLTAIQEGETIKSIGYWKTWINHYEFLYYRYHKDVLDIEISKIKGDVEKKPFLQKDKLEKLILPILDTMIKKDEDITIKNVCSKALISPTTLRLWGGNPILASMKKKQIRSRQNRYIEEIRIRIEEYFRKNSLSQISTTELYNYIGVKRTALWRVIPDITVWINQKIAKHNKIIKQKDK